MIEKATCHKAEKLCKKSTVSKCDRKLNIGSTYARKWDAVRRKGRSHGEKFAVTLRRDLDSDTGPVTRMKEQRPLPVSPSSAFSIFGDDAATAVEMQEIYSPSEPSWPAGASGGDAAAAAADKYEFSPLPAIGDGSSADTAIGVDDDFTSLSSPRSPKVQRLGRAEFKRKVKEFQQRALLIEALKKDIDGELQALMDSQLISC